MKYFIYLFLMGFFLFILEACAYIFRGNTDTFSKYMTRISNFCVFGIQFALLPVFIRYVYSICGNLKIELKKVYSYIVDGTAVIQILILIINIFTKWMYYFDNDNYYHRNYMFYAAIALTAIAPIVILILMIKYYKQIGLPTVIANLIFIFIPSLALLINSYMYGFSITNLGIGLSLIIMLFVYLKEWGKKENDAENAERKTKKIEIVTLFVIMALSMGASVASCIVSIDKISRENSQKDDITIAEMISTSVEAKLLEPIVVSKTMSNDTSVKNLLTKSKTSGATSIESEIKEYLSGISEGFNYQQAFIACDATKAYYITTGLEKYLDIENDPHDVWYKDFMASAKDYEFNLDTDEGNDFKLAVFVNKKIYDEHNNAIGAIGVAAVLDNLLNAIKEYEKEYNVTIELVNDNNIVQISSDNERIEEAVVNAGITSGATKSFNYSRKNNTATMVKYLDTFSWYLVITDNNVEKINTMEITTPSVIIFFAGIALLALAFSVITAHEKRTYRHMLLKKELSITDEMTGLFNRRAYEEDLFLVNKDKEMYTVILIDINGLKTANDTIGHEAGDELIRGLSHNLLNIFSPSKCYRIGGDEFVIVTTDTEEKVIESLNTLTNVCKNYNGEFIHEILFSYGYVVCKNNLDLSVYEAIHKADEMMYQQKEEYYKKTGKVRRT